MSVQTKLLERENKRQLQCTVYCFQKKLTLCIIYLSIFADRVNTVNTENPETYLLYFVDPE